MKSKLGFLTSISLKRKIKTKWFLIANILLLIGIVGIFNADSVIRFFGGDFSKKTEIYLLDYTDEASSLFDNSIHSLEKSFEKEGTYQVKKYDKEEEDLKKKIEDKDKRIGIIFEGDKKQILKAKVISDGYIDTIDFQLISNAIKTTKTQLAIQKSNIPLEQLNQIYGEMEIKREILDETKQTEEESMEAIMSAVFPVIILPFFMLTVFLVQMIGAEVNDEKTTRGMEIIISNVSPKTHFFSKVLAGNIFVVTQGILLMIYGGIGLIVKSMTGGHDKVSSITKMVSDIAHNVFTSSLIDKLVYIIPLALVLMVLTFIAYSVIAGVLASITTNTEDFQQLQTPIMIILLVGYYLSIMASAFKGALFIRILSYVPLISAILSPSLLVIGQIGIIDIVISIVIMIITNYLFIHYGLKVYKVGILNYSSEGLWRKMFKALKN